jgi:predicted dehydrogenase
MSLLSRVQQRPDCEVAGMWENDAPTREQLAGKPGFDFTHESFQELLESDCTIVAIGDAYARRGALAIEALKAGKHVISDKPICTRLEELDELLALAAAKNLKVGCQLDLIEHKAVRRAREILQSGVIGEASTVTIAAQHPLRLGSRAGWYFEPGMHGGTINDIGIHVFHLLPWLTGADWERVVAAREWNRKAVPHPHFKDCAQFWATLSNGLSCFADVSYLAPDAAGYDLPHYWRVTLHGTKGLLEFSWQSEGVSVISDSDKELRVESELEAPEQDYLRDFLEEIEERSSAGGLTTEKVFAASRWALDVQAAAQKP